MRQARDRLGWTQERLAAALDLDVGTVSRLESGDARLRTVHLLALEALEARAGAA